MLCSKCGVCKSCYTCLKVQLMLLLDQPKSVQNWFYFQNTKLTSKLTFKSASEINFELISLITGSFSCTYLYWTLISFSWSSPVLVESLLNEVLAFICKSKVIFDSLWLSELTILFSVIAFQGTDFTGAHLFGLCAWRFDSLNCSYSKCT